MIHSLKNQIFFLVVILVSILLVQILMSRAIQSKLLENQTVIKKSYRLTDLVYRLEIDVIDLQRNLLIYKETASSSSISRFYELMVQVNEKLDKVEQDVILYGNINLEKHLIKRMRNHLNDYKDNFSSVINGRSQGENIYTKNLQEQFSVLEKIIKKIALNGLSQNNYELLMGRHQALAEKFMNKYLLAPDNEYLSLYNNQISILKKINKQNNVNVKEAEFILSNLKKEFFKLTQVTRGYLFLVNVVMAGSANEFLYLTEKLRESVIDGQVALGDALVGEANASRFKTDVVSFAIIVISLVSAWFMSRKIIKPVVNITEVFNRLAKGQVVVEVPGENRK